MHSSRSQRPDTIFPRPPVGIGNTRSAPALDFSALAAIQDPGAAGELSRELLRYTVECAPSTSQSFSFIWVNSSLQVHAETYWGPLGIATDWATGPLSSSGQKMVSACLAARVDWYGASVAISMRSKHASLKTLPAYEELDDYPYVEGAFWGTCSPRPPT